MFFPMNKIINGLFYCSILWASKIPCFQTVSADSCAELFFSVANSNDLIHISVQDRIINNSIESIDYTAQKQWGSLTENFTLNVDSLQVKNECLLRICRLTNEPIRRQKCDEYDATKPFGVSNTENLEDENDWDKKVTSLLSVDCSCKTPKRTRTNVLTDSAEKIPEECPESIQGNRCELIKPSTDECARLYQEHDCTSCRFGYVSLPKLRSNSRFQISGKSMISSIALNDECSLTAHGYSVLNETSTIQLLFNNHTPERFSDINDQAYGINNFTCMCSAMSTYFNPPSEDPKQPSNNFPIFISVGAILFMALVVIAIQYLYRFGCRRSPLKYAVMIESKDIRRQDVIKSGRFGIVYRGSLRLKEEPRKWIPVAMKYVKSHTNSIYTQSIISEIKIMSRLGSHDNIVRFYGWCSNSVDASDIGDMCIIMELCLSSLKQYLEENRSSFRDTLQTIPQHYVTFGTENGNNLSSSNLIKWCLEIATGMEYINNQNIAHFDLAVRNVLLTNDLTAKIADFGLSQNLLESGYVENAALPMPVFYMAPEALVGNKVSTKTDIWSYGVCAWEIFSLGEEPTLDIIYADDKTVRQIIAQHYEDGVRLPDLENATLETQEKLLECWNMVPELRPDFTNLKEFFTNQIKNLKQVTVPDLQIIEV